LNCRCWPIVELVSLEMLRPHSEPAPCVEQAREVLGAHAAAEEVRPADVADEHRVARQDRDGPVRGGVVRHDERDGLGRMPRRLEEAQRDLAHRDRVAVVDGDVRELRLRGGAEVDLRAGALGELAVARDEVGVQVCLDDVPDRQPLRPRLIYIDVHVPAGVDHGRLAVRADHVGRLREAAQVELVEVHRWA
jgi:hypothetical protein